MSRDNDIRAFTGREEPSYHVPDEHEITDAEPDITRKPASVHRGASYMEELMYPTGGVSKPAETIDVDTYQLVNGNAFDEEGNAIPRAGDVETGELIFGEETPMSKIYEIRDNIRAEMDEQRAPETSAPVVKKPRMTAAPVVAPAVPEKKGFFASIASLYKGGMDMIGAAPATKPTGKPLPAPKPTPGKPTPKAAPGKVTTGKVAAPVGRVMPKSHAKLVLATNTAAKKAVAAANKVLRVLDVAKANDAKAAKAASAAKTQAAKAPAKAPVKAPAKPTTQVKGDIVPGGKGVCMIDDEWGHLLDGEGVDLVAAATAEVLGLAPAGTGAKAATKVATKTASAGARTASLAQLKAKGVKAKNAAVNAAKAIKNQEKLIKDMRAKQVAAAKSMAKTVTAVHGEDVPAPDATGDTTDYSDTSGVDPSVDDTASAPDTGDTTVPMDTVFEHVPGDAVPWANQKGTGFTRYSVGSKSMFDAGSPEDVDKAGLIYGWDHMNWPNSTATRWIARQGRNWMGQPNWTDLSSDQLANVGKTSAAFGAGPIIGNPNNPDFAKLRFANADNTYFWLKADAPKWATAEIDAQKALLAQKAAEAAAAAAAAEQAAADALAKEEAKQVHDQEFQQQQETAAAQYAAEVQNIAAEAEQTKADAAQLSEDTRQAKLQEAEDARQAKLQEAQDAQFMKMQAAEEERQARMAALYPPTAGGPQGYAPQAPLTDREVLDAPEDDGSVDQGSVDSGDAEGSQEFADLAASSGTSDETAVEGHRVTWADRRRQDRAEM